ncbi:MAG: RNA methyltransferase [Elusimicrobia bacterium]|nr:RNA methyltransferase [Elusimicrobiota bacterium]
MRIDAVLAADDPRLADYTLAREPAELKRRGIFLAESREVVAALVRAGRYRVRSVLATRSILSALAAELSLLGGEAPVYAAEPALMTGVVGYTVHRGCLAVGERGPGSSVPEMRAAAFGNPRLLVALEEVSNPDNVGGIFRNSLAFGAGGVLLGPGSGDPLYRKAIRTSMAATVRIPFAAVPDLPAALGRLREDGFTVVALTCREPAVDLDDFVRQGRPGKLVLVAGSEGAGLKPGTLAAADAAVRIPMAPDVDSLNVSVAVGIALHALSRLAA